MLSPAEKEKVEEGQSARVEEGLASAAEGLGSWRMSSTVMAGPSERGLVGSCFVVIVVAMLRVWTKEENRLSWSMRKMKNHAEFESTS